MSKQAKTITMGIVCIAILVFVIMYFALPQTYVTTDIQQYRNFSGHIEKEECDLFSGLRIFPEEITEEMQDISYYYECGNFALDNNYLIFFECEWTDGAFEEEINRLKAIYVERDFKRNNILYDEELFVHPAYISVYDMDQNDSGYMEYALVDAENSKIVYIYSQLTSNISEIIDENYLPLEGVKYGRVEDGYNMYYFTTKKGEGMYIK